MMKQLIATSLIILTGTVHAWAWGSEGHRIVAEIAEQLLEPAAARQVRDLLAAENKTTLAEVSTWADQIRGQRRNTAPWHYVNIPITASGYDAARDCPRKDCVVAKIDQFITEVRDLDAPPLQRLEALKFLVHFVADVHQPLHAADNGDRGGNDVRVEFNGRRTNLHAIWDTALLAPAVLGDERTYALKLFRAITPAEIEVWGTHSAAEWATESHAVAANSIYGQMSAGPGTLPEGFEANARPVFERQLQRAGVRLAAILNSIMR